MGMIPKLAQVSNIMLKCFEILASLPPLAANARPSGLKRHSRGGEMHSRREDAFKEGLGGIQEELMRTRKHTMCFIIRCTFFLKRGFLQTRHFAYFGA